MGLHILLALPVIVVPFRRSIEGLESALIALCKMRGAAAALANNTGKFGSMQVLGESLLEQSEQQ
jgi:hypothetical protein